MKDLTGNVCGIQERLMLPIILNWKITKSKVRAGDNVGYFYQKIDFNSPVIIVEWEIDWASVAYLPNIIWLQNIAGLRKLIEWLKEKWVKEIYLLVDNDNPADQAISKLLDMDISFLSNVFDCRELLWFHKDVNEYIVTWGEITMKNIQEEGKSLKDFIDLRNYLFKYGKSGGLSIKHDNFSKYLIWKFSYESTDRNVFSYNRKAWLREPIRPDKIEKTIMTHLEKLIPSEYEIRNKDVEEIFKLIIKNSFSEELWRQLIEINENDINLEDGILDIRTNIVRPYSKKEYKRHKLPYYSSLLKEERTPQKFIKFLNEVFEDYPEKEEIIQFLRVFISHLFLPITKYEKWLFCYWCAASWKSTLLYVIQNLIWENNVSNLPLHQMDKPERTSSLLSKLVNISTETKCWTDMDSASIKQIVSWEKIESRFLYRDNFFFSPYVRLISWSNSIGNVKNPEDGSVLRRFVFINFRISFIWRENCSLKKELLTELDDIFSRSIKLLPDLLLNDEFTVPQILIDQWIQSLKEQDNILLFLEDKIENDPVWKIYNSDLYPIYEKFCKEMGEVKSSQIVFSKRLKALGYKPDRDYKWRYFHGMKIRKNQNMTDMT